VFDGLIWLSVTSGFSQVWVGPVTGEKALKKAEKHELVSSLHETLKSAEVVVVAHYAGLTVAEITDLRRQMREAGASVQVAKNSLVKLALQGTDAEPISGLFTGQTIIATSGDPVAAPKVASEFAKKNEKLVILGGAMGSTVLDTAGVNVLATMPSLDELRGKIIGVLQAPATKIAQVLQAPGGQLARVFSAYAKKDEAA
jgi:large subunit ribosomal protein L10